MWWLYHRLKSFCFRRNKSAHIINFTEQRIEKSLKDLWETRMIQECLKGTKILHGYRITKEEVPRLLIMVKFGQMQSEEFNQIKKKLNIIGINDAIIVSREMPEGMKSEIQLSNPVNENENEVARARISLSLLRKGEELKLRAPEALLQLIRIEPSGGDSPLFKYEFLVSSNDQILLRSPFSSQLFFNFKPNRHLLIWLTNVESEIIAFYAQFADAEEESVMSKAWNHAFIESNRQEDYAKSIKKENEHWAMAVHVDNEENNQGSIEEKDNTEWKQTPTKKVSFNTKKTIWEYSTDDYSDSDSDEDNPAPSLKHEQTNYKNGNLSVGQHLNRTFVTRGPVMGVFRHDDDGQLEYLSKIPTIRTLDAQTFTPSHSILTQQDQKMLMLNPSQTNNVYVMDLNIGQIVQEYGVSEDWNIRNLAPVSKYAEQTHEQTVVGVNNNSIFTLDPRIHSKNKLAQRLSYADSPQFTCATTTGSGKVAVGSQKGEIRLFNDISKRSKSLLPGLGDPIIGLDVTEDGSWLLATTRRYLLIIPTIIEGNSLQSGFDTSLTAKSQPPIKLQLTAEDMVTYKIHELNFTHAHFNKGDLEESILTSTGPYIITWNFRRAKLGYRSDYKIKICSNEIVAHDFLYGHQDRVVVTLPDNIYLEKRAAKK